MTTIEIYKEKWSKAKIEQTPLSRDWMENTSGRHAYKCFPISLANTIGLSISFTEDIEFIWDGIDDTISSHVNILKGHDMCNTVRGNATISFITGLHFKTSQNISMLSIAPPNYFLDGAIPYTSIISTSFFEDAFPAAWKIVKDNQKITIPAGTPVATLIPISLSQMSEMSISIYDKIYTEEERERINKKMIEWQRISNEGKFTNFYRDAVDYEGNKIGNHEVKSLKLKIKDFTTI